MTSFRLTPPKPPVNQCDGCQRRLPVDEHGLHNPAGYINWESFVCTADRYRKKP